MAAVVLHGPCHRLSDGIKTTRPLPLIDPAQSRLERVVAASKIQGEGRSGGASSPPNKGSSLSISISSSLSLPSFVFAFLSSILFFLSSFLSSLSVDSQQSVYNLHVQASLVCQADVWCFFPQLNQTTHVARALQPPPTVSLTLGCATIPLPHLTILALHTSSPSNFFGRSSRLLSLARRSTCLHTHLFRPVTSSHGPTLRPPLSTLFSSLFLSLSTAMGRPVREIVHLQTGQCGNQIGAKFWYVHSTHCHIIR